MIRITVGLLLAIAGFVGMFSAHYAPETVAMRRNVEARAAQSPVGLPPLGPAPKEVPYLIIVFVGLLVAASGRERVTNHVTRTKPPLRTLH